MTLLSVCQKVAKFVGMTVPSEVASSTDRDAVELLATVEEMAERITQGHDWQLLSRIHTLTGDGSEEDFDLPTDYTRMMVKSQLWSSSLETPLSPISDLDEWLGMDVQSFDFVVNAWTIYGGQIHIKPALATGVTAKFFYQSNLVVRSGSSNVASFTNDADTYRLDENLLALGAIWKFRADKGLPYAEQMQDYEILLSRLVTKDKGSRILRLGMPNMPRDTKIAYPQSING